jgi:hypothetical protein
MHVRHTLLAMLLLAACAHSQKGRAEGDTAAQPKVHANDNRSAGGMLRGGVLTLRLEIGEGLWQPERFLRPSRMLAFGESGGALTTPGPLIRIREGTLVDVSIRNRVGSDIIVYGLHERPGSSAPLRVPAHVSEPGMPEPITTGEHRARP